MSLPTHENARVTQPNFNAKESLITIPEEASDHRKISGRFVPQPQNRHWSSKYNSNPNTERQVQIQSGEFPPAAGLNSMEGSNPYWQKQSQAQSSQIDNYLLKLSKEDLIELYKRELKHDVVRQSHQVPLNMPVIHAYPSVQQPPNPLDSKRTSLNDVNSQSLAQKGQNVRQTFYSQREVPHQELKLQNPRLNKSPPVQGEVLHDTNIDLGQPESINPLTHDTPSKISKKAAAPDKAPGYHTPPENATPVRVKPPDFIPNSHLIQVLEKTKEATEKNFELI